MRLFGTDGIRGKVNTHPMTPETVLKVGLAAAKVLKKEHGRNMVLIGKDTRLSGYMIESALVSGLCSMGMDVTLVGPIPTPGVAYLTRALRADAGIVISASHNSFEDNGIKFFNHDGLKLPDEVEDKIEELANGQGIFRRRPHGSDVGRAIRLDDAAGRYIEYIKSTFPKGMTLEGIKVVLDCANGSAYKVSPAVLRELGAEVVVLNDTPDGVNINKDCGSMHLDALAVSVKEHKADVGVAHDGDADRTLFCDEKGNIIDGDHILGMCAVEMKQENRLNGNTVVATVMSNLGLEKFLHSHDIKLLRTKVGDRYVTKKMIKGGYNLGGEQSGHIVMFDYNTTGDGPITALHVLYLMKKTGKKLSKLASAIEIFPQVLINVEVPSKHGWSTNADIQAAVQKVEKKIEGTGRVLVRASGTEQKIRVMLEGQEQTIIERYANDIAKVIKSSMS